MKYFKRKKIFSNYSLEPNIFVEEINSIKQYDNIKNSTDIENENAVESNAESALKESKLPVVLVQKLNIGKKIFADGKEVGKSVNEENWDTPKLFIYSSDDKKTSELKKSTKKGGKLLMQCSLCSYSTNSKLLYKSHQAVHTDVYLYCSQCSFKTKRKSYLEKHETLHFSRNLLECHECNFKTMFRLQLKKHMLKHSSGNVYSEDQNYDVDKLPSRKYNAELFKCPNCDFETKYKRYLDRHLLKKHKDLQHLRCSNCNFVTDVKSNFECHLLECPERNLQTISTIYMLDDSSDEFENKEDDIKYQQCYIDKLLNTEVRTKLFKCPKCKFETKYKQNLTRHISAKHKDVHLLICRKCDFVTDEKNNYEYHLLECPERNLKTIPTIYMSDHSSKEFDYEEDNIENQKGDIDNLSNTGDNTKLYKCPKCDFKTKYKNNMGRHISKKHENVQPLYCSKCHFVTDEKSQLECHLLECSESNLKTIPTIYMLDHSSEEFENEEDGIKNQECYIDKPSNSEDLTKLKCSKCNFETKYKQGMSRHISAKHKDVQLLFCIGCDFVTDEKEELECHILECSEVNLESLPKKQLDIDMLEHSSEDKLKCEEDNEIIADNTKLFKCSKCEFQTKFRFSLNKHVSKKHLNVDRQYCTKCEFSTDEKSIFESHVQSHIETKLPNSLSCDFKTEFEETFDTHLKNDDKESRNKDAQSSDESKLTTNVTVCSDTPSNKYDSKPYKCSHCNYKTDKKHNLARHILNNHENLKQYKCEYCSYESNEKFCLEKHLLKEHKSTKSLSISEEIKTERMEVDAGSIGEHMEEEELFKCPDCNFQTKRKSAFTSHLSQHTNKNLLRCFECDFIASEENKLDAHILSHTKRKAVSASNTECEDHFRTSKLKKVKDKQFLHNVKIVKGEDEPKSETRRHKCPKCNFKANNKRFLDSHLRTHKEEKVVHECSVCSYRTVSRQNLKVHMFKHSNFSLKL